jgi:hypothetical protein
MPASFAAPGPRRAIGGARQSPARSFSRRPGSGAAPTPCGPPGVPRRCAAKGHPRLTILGAHNPLVVIPIENGVLGTLDNQAIDFANFLPSQGPALVAEFRERKIQVCHRHFDSWSDPHRKIRGQRNHLAQNAGVVRWLDCNRKVACALRVFRVDGDVNCPIGQKLGN